jgi:hypothetical protein
LISTISHVYVKLSQKVAVLYAVFCGDPTQPTLSTTRKDVVARYLSPWSRHEYSCQSGIGDTTIIIQVWKESVLTEVGRSRQKLNEDGCWDSEIQHWKQ